MTASASTPQAALTLEALSVSFATDAGPVDAVK